MAAQITGTPVTNQSLFWVLIEGEVRNTVRFMNPKFAQPEAVLFDAYGTLFDVYSVGLLAEQLFPGRGDALAALWRDKQIEYTRLTSMSGRYRPFWELTRAGLRFAALKLGPRWHAKPKTG
jgi:hypothetical protein